MGDYDAPLNGCPFCGKEVAIHDQMDQERGDGWWFIECEDCSVQMGHAYLSNDIFPGYKLKALRHITHQWNKRY
jgi:hypothetical protein